MHGPCLLWNTAAMRSCNAPIIYLYFLSVKENHVLRPGRGFNWTHNSTGWGQLTVICSPFVTTTVSWGVVNATSFTILSLDCPAVNLFPNGSFCPPCGAGIQKQWFMTHLPSWRMTFILPCFPCFILNQIKFKYECELIIGCDLVGRLVELSLPRVWI